MGRLSLGSSIDEFLAEQGILENAQTQAAKVVISWQIAEAMKRKKVSKSRMGQAAQDEPIASGRPA